MILVRLLPYLRRHWPRTHILVRGDSHFATPEVIEVMAHRRFTDFIFGVNAIKAVKCDLHSDRTSATTFLTNALRLLLSCAAYVLHHALRTHTLAHTALATAQPCTVNAALAVRASDIAVAASRCISVLLMQ
jgi:hypothetical protein